MTRRWQLLLLTVCAVAIGCHRDPYFEAYVETLNAEKRALEDQIYDLQFDYQKLNQELEACRKREREEAGEKDDRKTPSPARKRTDQGSDLRQPRSVRPKPREEPDESLDLSPPKIETGTPVEPTPAPATGGEESPAQEAPASPRSSKTLRSNMRETAATTADGEGRWVTQVVVNSARTRGADFDDRPGDDGIIIVFEPRNAVGDFVPLAGPVTLVLLDPSQTGEAARVARWDFDADEMGRGLLPDAKAFQLKAPWKGAPPEHNQLNLYVRYETIDGRKLEASHELQVSLAGQSPQRWTPRPASRAIGGSEPPAASVRESPLPAPAKSPRLNSPTAEELDVPPPAADSQAPSPGAAPRDTSRPAASATQRNRGFWRPQR